MEKCDLSRAQSLLAPGFAMIFPGNRRFDSLEQLVEFSRGRYKRASKAYDRFDVAPGAGGEAVVYCHGTLSGEWLSGEDYAGIRFIDRFTIKEGKLVDQMVWNDMAEALAAKLTSS